MILTPDQRVRVFVSSTLQELAEERAAARQAIENLRLTPVLFELGARPHPPRELYRQYLEQSDVFVGIYGESYGWVAPGADISGLEDEYLLAERRPRLVYVKRPASERDPRLAALIERIERTADVSYKPFTDADELRTLIEDDLALLLSERFDGHSAGRRFRTWLPAGVDRFVGRAAELDELELLLTGSDTRLVTVAGPGGVGKTRLALEAARRVAPSFGAGAHFVPLSEVADPRLVAQTLYDSLGTAHGTTSPLDAVVDELGDAHLLLVLDNFEHVLAAAPDVERLLERCPRLSVVATSRSVLNLRGERELRIEPLEEADAVSLFVDRASAASHSFELSEENARDVEEICRRLDRIPLALELAAAHVRLLPAGAILEHLGGPLGLRSRGAATYPDRQQTLQATIEWSFGLLDEEERDLCERVSVFRGGFTLAAAEAVASRSGNVLELVATLVESSLVRHDPRAGSSRYSMLETIRAAGLERLEQRGELSNVRRRHSAFFLALVEDAGRQLRRARHTAALDTLDDEVDNVRAALEWLLEQGDAERVVDAGWALLPYWTLRERLIEGRTWLSGARKRAPLGDLARARALTAEGVLEFWLSDYRAAATLLSEGLGLAREGGDEETLAVAQLALGTMEATRGGGVTMLEESRRLFAERGDAWGEAMALVAIAWGLNAAETAAPLALYEEALEKAGGLGYAAETLALGALGRRHALRGESGDAKRVLADALERTLVLRIPIGTALYLELLADVAASEDDVRLAVRLSAAADALVESLAAVLPPLAGRREARWHAVRSRLGDAAYEAERAAGRALLTEDATAQALKFARG